MPNVWLGTVKCPTAGIRPECPGDTVERKQACFGAVSRRHACFLGDRSRRTGTAFLYRQRDGRFALCRTGACRMTDFCQLGEESDFLDGSW